MKIQSIDKSPLQISKSRRAFTNATLTSLPFTRLLVLYVAPPSSENHTHTGPPCALPGHTSRPLGVCTFEPALW